MISFTPIEYNLIKIGLISAQFTIVLMTFIIALRLSRNLYKIDLRYFKWFWLIDGFYILCCLYTSYQIADTSQIFNQQQESLIKLITDLLDVSQSILCFTALFYTDYNFPLRFVFQKSRLFFIIPSVVLVVLVFYTYLIPVNDKLFLDAFLGFRIIFNFLALFNVAFMLLNMTRKIKESSYFLLAGFLLHASAQFLGVKIILNTSGTLHDPASGWVLGLISKLLVFWGLLQIFKNEALRSITMERLLFRTFHELSNNLYGIGTPVKKILNLNWKEKSIDPRAEARQIERTYETLMSIIEGSTILYKNALFDTSSDQDVENTLTKLFESKKEDVRLNTLVDVAVRLVKRSASKDFRVMCDYGGGCWIKCHKHEIIQVMVNLLKNAKEAFPNGSGHVNIVTRNDYEGSNDEQKRVFVSIEDDGPGIPLEIQDKIFNEGYSTKEKEIKGFGLAVVKDIIENNYGDILVKSPIHPSIPNPGTKFTIIFNKQNEKTNAASKKG